MKIVIPKGFKLLEPGYKTRLQAIKAAKERIRIGERY